MIKFYISWLYKYHIFISITFIFFDILHKDVLYFFVTLPIEKMYSVVPEVVKFPFLSSCSKSYIIFLLFPFPIFLDKNNDPTVQRLWDHPSYSFHKASSLVTIFIPLYDRIFFHLLLDFNYRLHMISFTNIQILLKRRYP